MGYIVSVIYRRWTVYSVVCAFLVGFISRSALSQPGKTDESKNIKDLISYKVIPGENTIGLISQIREVTRKYKSTKEAEKAGYRPFGPDMPNMGQHWINTRMALAPTIELSKPSTLTYLTINGETILTGVAYTTSVQPNEAMPDLPSQEMKWHFHSGKLEDEAHGIHRVTESQDQKVLTKLAMVHAWVWTENPAGIFSPDNWSLSFLRHGLEPPSSIKVTTSKALFLASGQVDYYLKFIKLCVQEDTFDKDSIRNILITYSDKIKFYASNIPTNRIVLKTEQERIENIWNDMWDLIEAELGPRLWNQVDKFL